MTQLGEPAEPAAEIAGLRSRADALRQAAALPGAELGPVLEAALAELDAAISALGARGAPDGEYADALHAERRLLQAAFQQAPVPLFLLGLDGTVRRANTAAGGLIGASPGYPAGKLFTAFIDLPQRAAAQTQLAAAARTGETRRLRCRLLTPAGAADCVLMVAPVSVRGDAGQLVVMAAPRGTAQAGAARAARAAPSGGDPAGAVEAMSRRLDLVTAATRVLLDSVTLRESVVLQRCARLFAREFAAWAIVDMERRQRLHRLVVVGPQDQRSEDLARAVVAVGPQPGSAPHQVHESGSSLLVAHAEDAGILGEDAEGVPLLMLLGVTSLLCVPLTDGERRYGVLTLVRQPSQGHFSIGDAGLAEELAEQMALAIRVDRMFRRRTEIAEALQASLLPGPLRQIPGAEIAATHLGASDGQDVGGDFYDVFPAGPGWGVTIGDVCGKGEETAAVAAGARHAIRVLAHLDPAPVSVLRGANDIMLAEEFGGRFVTAAAGHLQWQDGRLHVVLGSAGHPRPVLIKPDGQTQVLPGGGLPLGIFADAEPATAELDLEPGDVLFFLTDGVTSACGPELGYFEDRLADELAALAGQPADVVVSRVRELVLEFCHGELRDDATMLAVRVGKPPGG